MIAFWNGGLCAFYTFSKGLFLSFLPFEYLFASPDAQNNAGIIATRQHKS